MDRSIGILDCLRLKVRPALVTCSPPHDAPSGTSHAGKARPGCLTTTAKWSTHTGVHAFLTPEQGQKPISIGAAADGAKMLISVHTMATRVAKSSGPVRVEKEAINDE
ncbi:hypothetical protein [Streptomyces sp. NPDC087859]|uniref:hypothetical protein n=1 Tax=Streptomyces sp. NPDC087859 TaxID=3365812 RepID=UPI0038180639